MASLTQTMAASPRVFAAEKRNAKCKPSLIMVNNVLGAQNAVIQVVDRYTTSASNGAAAALRTDTRLNINVSMMACVSIQDELKDLKILGQLELTIGVPDANCIVTVAWDHQ